MNLLARLLFLVAMAVLPAVLVQAYTEAHHRAEHEGSRREQALRLLDQLRSEQARIVEGIRQVLTVTARMEMLAGHRYADCQTFMRGLARDLPPHQNLHATDADGRIVCATEELSLGFNITDRRHFQLARDHGGFSTGEFIIRRGTGEAVLPFAIPYYADDGRFAGVVVMTLNLRWLNDYLARKPLPEHTTVTIGDRNGILLARLPADIYRVGGPMPPQLMPLVKRPQAGLENVTNYVGLPKLIAYSPITDEPRDIFLSLTFDQPQMFSALATATTKGIGLTIITLAAALGVATLFYRTLIGAPLSRLMAAAYSWRDGDLAARTGMKGSTELERLGEAFDEMAATIQDRELVREKARSAERRTAQVLESTTDGVFEVGHDWRILYMNTRACAMTSGGRDVTGAVLWEQFPEIVGTVFEEQYSRAMRDRSMVEFKAALATSQTTFAVRAFPTDAGLAVYFQDVTARQRAEHELQEARGRLTAMFEHAPLGFAFFDRDHRYVSVNPQLAEMNGLPAASHIGRRLSEVVPVNAKLIDPMIDRVFADGEPIQVEMAGETPLQPGVTRNWLVGIYPVDVADERRWVGAVVLEITERIHTEEALRAAKAEAEQANRDKGRFLAAASHDLRQPVQSLMLFTSALAGQLGQHKAAPVVGFIEKSTLALKQLLDSLLDVSRLDAGVVVPDVTDFSVNELLEQLAREYRLQAEGKGLSLELVNNPGRAHSDRTLVERILRNLIENALRYTEEGRVILAIRPEPGLVRVEICDTGCGIPPEQQDAIFREFYQLHNPERDRAQGLGLGLSIVQRLARLLDLPLGLDSEPGVGSRFWIDLPASTTETIEPIPDVDQPERRLSVLVVDDEEMVRSGLQMQLQAWGHAPIQAADVHEAVTAAEKQHPDLVIADYRLRAGHTGIEAVRQIQDMAGHKIPSIILTGDTAPERIAEVQQSGHTILHKPVTPPALRTALQHAISAADNFSRS